MTTPAARAWIRMAGSAARGELGADTSEWPHCIITSNDRRLLESHGPQLHGPLSMISGLL